MIVLIGAVDAHFRFLPFNSPVSSNWLLVDWRSKNLSMDYDDVVDLLLFFHMVWFELNRK